MQTPSVVKKLNIFKQTSVQLFQIPVLFVIHPLLLQSFEKAFGAGFVVRIPFSAHTAFQIMLFQVFQIYFAAVLATPIAVKHDFDCRSALRKSIGQGSFGQFQNVLKFENLMQIAQKI